MARARSEGGGGGGGMLIAKESFAVGTTVVPAGTVVPADSPAVAGREELFETTDEHASFGSEAWAQHTAGDDRLHQMHQDQLKELEKSMEDAATERERLEKEAAERAQQQQEFNELSYEEQQERAVKAREEAEKSAAKDAAAVQAEEEERQQQLLAAAEEGGGTAAVRVKDGEGE